MAEDPESSGVDARDDHRARQLERIADLLGCPLETVAERSHAASDLKEIGELLRLWLKVEDPRTRRAVIEHLRQAVGGAY